MDTPYAIEMLHITKRFPGIVANDDITLQLRKGEIHALLGENGAGKSTLMSVLFGLYQAEEGEIRKDGKVVSIKNPNDANSLGIGMVHQHFKLVECFTVLDNIIMGVEPTKHGFLQKGEARKKVLALSEKYGLQVDPDARIEDITVGMQQRTEILKMLYRDNEILIFDEPTAVLTPQETDELFSVIRRIVRERGMTVILITHKLYEVMAISDRVGVMRKGKLVGVEETKNVNERMLASMMVGRPVLYDQLEKTGTPGAEEIRVENLTVQDNRGLTAVDGLSLSVRAGEILGIGGLVGAGRSELVEGIFGMHELTSGEIFVKGKQVKVHSPKDIIKEGVALITEDRKVTGLNLSGSVNDNIAMVAIKKLLSHGLYNKNKARAASMEYIKKLNIKTPSGDQITGNLSGGNQQKIVIAKWLLNDPDIIILDEPTRGIDVGAKRDIYLLLGKLVQQGKAVIMISSEIPELMGVCDRIMVMCEGNLSGEVQRDAFSQERIMTLASAIEV